MNYRSFRLKAVIVSAMVVMGLVLAQESGYLTQKLMVENDLRTRIREALSKIMEPSKFVVDVSVELEVSDSYEEQVTILPRDPGAESLAETPSATLADELEQEYVEESRYTTGLPIPGFEFEVEGGSKKQIEKGTPTEKPQAIQSTGKDRITSKTSSVKRAARANILHQSINIIIQEGVAPEMIENIRQIVTVASQFDLERGDQLNLMTATFRQRRDAKTAEQVILKSISDKIERLEQKRIEEEAASDSWEEKLRRYKEDEAKRREEDREYFKSELGKLEQAARQRAYDQEKTRILKQDSIKLAQLGQEVITLREKLASPTLSDSQAMAVQEEVKTREDEITDIDRQISERLASLEAVQAELDRMQNRASNGSGSTILLAVLGAMLLLAIIALIIIIMNRSKTPSYPMPPPYMYPPRRRKKKRSPEVSNNGGNGTQQQQAPVQQQPSPEEDPGVLQSEIGDIRKSIVSMSVGQPETATRIVKEWIQEEAPPPPPEPEAPTPPEEEPESGKKKKKRK